MEEYKKQIGHFNPDKYDPDIWMKAAKRAGILRNGEKLAFDHKDNTLTIEIPANLITELVDVVKVDF